MVNSAKASISAGLAVLSAVLLSGCFFATHNGPVRVSTVGGEMAIAFCAEQSISTIEVLQLAPGGDRVDDWQLLWEARGPRMVGIGEVIVPAYSEGFASTSFNDIFMSGEGYEYQITVNYNDDRVYGPVLKAPNGGLVEGTWVTTDDRTVAAPCESYGSL